VSILSRILRLPRGPTPAGRGRLATKCRVRPRPSERWRRRPCLEALEGRTVPSAFPAPLLPVAPAGVAAWQISLRRRPPCQAAPRHTTRTRAGRATPRATAGAAGPTTTAPLRWRWAPAPSPRTMQTRVTGGRRRHRRRRLRPRDVGPGLIHGDHSRTTPRPAMATTSDGLRDLPVIAPPGGAGRRPCPRPRRPCARAIA
jgi:hypothetical protein